MALTDDEKYAEVIAIMKQRKISPERLCVLIKVGLDWLSLTDEAFAIIEEATKLPEPQSKPKHDPKLN